MELSMCDSQKTHHIWITLDHRLMNTMVPDNQITMMGCSDALLLFVYSISV